MVAVVLLTTLLTPISLRVAFHLKSRQDVEDELRGPGPSKAFLHDRENISSTALEDNEGVDDASPGAPRLRIELPAEQSRFA
jgi:hypothetical protein